LEQFEIKAKVRKSFGNGPARVLRREGKIPAVLYGPKTEPISLSVEIQDLEQITKKSNIARAILNLVIQNGKELIKPAMIKELQMHPVSGKFLHVDFYEIDMSRKIRVKVPVVVKGKAKGVELGGFLQIIRRDVDVLCLPSQIPTAIEVDVTDLDIGDSFHVNQIQFEGDIEIPSDVNYTIITVLSPKVEAEVVEEEPEEVAEEEGEEAAAEGKAPEAAEE
jgi:large subunit ribosomal protein L25